MTTATATDIPRGKKARSSSPPADAPAQQPPRDHTLQTLALDRIAFGDNVRTEPQPADVEDLTASIAEVGVISPIKVRRTPDGWQVIWGQRRVVAARLAGLTEIPAMIVDDERAAAAIAIEQLTENLQRQDLKPIDEAKALRRILDETPDLSQGELAKRLGRSESWLSNSLRLLGLDERVQEKIQTGELTASHGKAIASLPAKAQREIAETVSREGTSSRDLERELEWKRQQAENEEDRKRRTEKALPKAIAALEAAGVPKGEPVYVKAYGFDKLEPGLRKAGYEMTDAFLQDAPPDGCDCKGWILEMDRKWTVKRACLSDHWQRARDREANTSRQAQAKAEKERKAKLERIRTTVEAQLEANPPAPAVLRLALFHLTSGTWPRPEYAALAERDVAELRKTFAFKLTEEYRLRDVSIDELLADLTGTVPGQTSIDDVAGDEPAGTEVVDMASLAMATFGDDIESVTDEGPAESPEAAMTAVGAELHEALAEQPATPAPKPGKGSSRRRSKVGAH